MIVHIQAVILEGVIFVLLVMVDETVPNEYEHSPIQIIPFTSTV